MNAVQSFCQNAGGRSFAGSARANEEISMRETLFRDGVLKSAHDMILTEDVVEYLRAIFASENLVTHTPKIRRSIRKQKPHCRSG